MNTTPNTSNTIADKLKRENLLRSRFHYHYPMWGKHGDACIDIGHIATPLRLRATNHDSQHEVYGVSLHFPQASGDARSSQELPAHATEQRSLTYTDAGCIVQKPPYFSQSTPTDLPAHATEQRCFTDADAARIVQKPQDFSQSTENVVASGSQNALPQFENEAQLVTADAEQLIPTLETKQQDLAYFIINAFTHELALDDTRAEAIIKAALVDEPSWPHETP